eukprot:4956259-Prymnesium_polylepis.1
MGPKRTSRISGRAPAVYLCGRRELRCTQAILSQGLFKGCEGPAQTERSKRSARQPSEPSEPSTIASDQLSD